ncbi:MAG TPA: hypothetical protein VG267_05750 [Terracidiphilus sp.]|nr:hypothetical protein [Terracidiphilus sp.]
MLQPAPATPQFPNPESPTRFFILDGPQELSFILDPQQKVSGMELITQTGHHRLDKSVPR